VDDAVAGGAGGDLEAFEDGDAGGDQGAEGAGEAGDGGLAEQVPEDGRLEEDLVDGQLAAGRSCRCSAATTMATMAPRMMYQ
jgi:hypothetical protein